MRRDVHPAEVSLPDGSIVTGARVFVTSHRLLAWKVTQERRGTELGKIEQVVNLRIEDPFSVVASRNTLLSTQTIEVETTEGTAYVNRGRGCGCHSPLKALAAPVPWSRR